MAETRTYQGATYSREAPGQPWVLVGSPRQGRVITDPYKVSQESREQSAERRAAEANARANAAEARAAEAEARTKTATEARGGVDTTESERTAAFLATRVAGGLRNLSQIGNIGAPSLAEATIGGTLIGNYATEEARQRTINAQRDILDAALTLGTGAAYTKEQIDSYRTSYFPQPGDEPGTMADKQRRLQVLLEAAKLKAGAAAPQIEQAVSSIMPSQITQPSANPLTADQQRIYDAFLAGNPNATAEQLIAFTQASGLPPLENAAEIIQARQSGAGVSPASAAIPSQVSQNIASPGSYDASLLSQGLSGINEGVASALGFPIDVTTGAINLIPRGINAIANTEIPLIENPIGGGEWWRGLMGDVGAIRPESDASGAPFLRRAAQSVGGALVPAAGMAGNVRNVGAALLSGIGGGIGGATAQQVAPGNMWAEIAGELAGSFVPGASMFGLARRAGRQQAMASVPTIQELKQQSADLYGRAEVNGVTASQAQTSQLARDFRKFAQDEGLISPTGRISEAYPKAKEAIRLMDDYSKGEMNPKQMQSVRKVLTDALQSQEGAERRIGSILLRQFDDYVAPLAPELAQARNVASRYLQAEEVQRAIDLAEPRAAQFTQSGPENALRTEFRNLDRQIIRGDANFNPAVAQAITDVSRGTPDVNIARNLGKLAPTGVVSAGLGGGVPFMVGTALGGPAVGTAASLGTMGLGGLGRAYATRGTTNAANMAELLARSGGDIPVAQQIDPELQRAIYGSIAAQLANVPYE